jgi:hypothetical protein
MPGKTAGFSQNAIQKRRRAGKSTLESQDIFSKTTFKKGQNQKMEMSWGCSHGGVHMAWAETGVPFILKPPRGVEILSWRRRSASPGHSGFSLAARYSSIEGVTSRGRRRRPIRLNSQEAILGGVDSLASEVANLHVDQHGAEKGCVLDDLALGSRELVGTAQVGLDLGDELLGLEVGRSVPVQPVEGQQAPPRPVWRLRCSGRARARSEGRAAERGFLGRFGGSPLAPSSVSSVIEITCFGPAGVTCRLPAGYRGGQYTEKAQ